jgi:hypothetical protein
VLMIGGCHAMACYTLSPPPPRPSPPTPGVPRAQLAELHGNCFAERCTRCGAEYVREFEMDTVRRWAGGGGGDGRGRGGGGGGGRKEGAGVQQQLGGAKPGVPAGGVLAAFTCTQASADTALML